MAKTATLLDLESLADESLEDIAEAPEYINPPAGDYILRSVSGEIRTYEEDDGTTKQSIRVVIAVKEALELVSDEPPVPEGSLFSLSFQGTKEGLGAFKRELRKMTGLEVLQPMTLNEYFQMLETELEFRGRISYRKFKDREYINLRIL
ncbi:MAG TPA: hypothetical protein PLJ29_00070 [Leptospiraceae bacterium]|jgi:hypothetical protein|nr:hypothetical protein [Leptospiraceae bacterium]HNI24723.1 hypothetical protein [Leptospiraceae bacterium]